MSTGQSALYVFNNTRCDIDRIEVTQNIKKQRDHTQVQTRE